MSGTAAPGPVTVYVSIGNSEDKLTQREWSNYVLQMATDVASYASTIHGAWASNTVSPFQNAAWCLEFASEAALKTAKDNAAILGRAYRQDSVAWAVAETEFL